MPIFRWAQFRTATFLEIALKKRAQSAKFSRIVQARYLSEKGAAGRIWGPTHITFDAQKIGGRLTTFLYRTIDSEKNSPKARRFRETFKFALVP